MAYLTSLLKLVGGFRNKQNIFIFEKCLIFLLHGDLLLKLDNKEGKFYLEIRKA